MNLIWTVLFQYFEVVIVLLGAFMCMTNTELFIRDYVLAQYKDDKEFMGHPGSLFLGKMYAVLLFIYALTEFVIFYSANIKCIVYYTIILGIGDVLHCSTVLKFYGMDILHYPVIFFGHLGLSVILCISRIKFVYNYWNRFTMKINLQTKQR